MARIQCHFQSTSRSTPISLRVPSAPSTCILRIRRVLQSSSVPNAQSASSSDRSTNSGCAKPRGTKSWECVGAICWGFAGCTYVSFQCKTLELLGRPAIEPWRLPVVAHLPQALLPVPMKALCAKPLLMALASSLPGIEVCFGLVKPVQRRTFANRHSVISSMFDHQELVPAQWGIRKTSDQGFI